MTDRVGELIEVLGTVPLPSGAEYCVEVIRTGSADAARLAFVSVSKHRREIIIFAGAVRRVAELLNEYAESRDV